MADPVYVLTAAEGAAVLRCANTDAEMLSLLPQVDAFLFGATGRYWASDAPIHETAKSAARMLLVMWHENPGMVASGESTLNFGLTACLVQLRAEALSYHSFYGRNGAGAIRLLGAMVGDRVTTLVGIAGVTGSQATKFESTISIRDEIQQTDTGDLSANAYRAKLTGLGEL